LPDPSGRTGGPAGAGEIPEPARADRHVVLVTRPEPGSGETAERLSAMGLLPVTAPLQRIEKLPARLPPPGRLAALLLTSRHAIAPIPPDWRTLPTFVVGDATAERTRHAGFLTVESAAGDAADLAGMVAERLTPAGKPLLLATGQGHGGPLCGRLRRVGFRVIRRVVYRTRAVEALPDAAAAELAGAGRVSALFFSAQAARLFVRLVRAAGLEGAIRTRDALAISPAVGVALRGLPWGAIRVADRPNQDALLALLR
jgi:uroporphyrinogen-III synthase